MRKSSKPRVVWLPPDQTNNIQTDPNNGYIITSSASVSTNTPIGVVEVPLTIDSVPDPTTATLADVESSAYRLRRIVGKVFVIGDQFDDESGIEAIIVTAGIIVRRTADDGSSSLAFTSNPTTVHPGQAQNWGDPWIWRRSWIFGNPQIPPLGPTLPNNNIFVAGMDGPHVDQKTARVIGPEERLFFDLGVTVLFAGGPSEIQNDTFAVLDLRCLGTMKASMGNRRNASR